MVVSVVHTHGGLFDEQPSSPYAIPCVSWDVLHGVLMKLYARIAFLIAKFRPFIYLVNLNGHIVAFENKLCAQLQLFGFFMRLYFTF